MNSTRNRDGRPRFADCVPSPGGWCPPESVRPAWDWTPPGGVLLDRESTPRWIRLWYHAPLINRFAHVWMWHRGHWLVEPAAAGSPEES